MNIVITQSKFCHSNFQLLNNYPILKTYKGHYTEYIDYSNDDNFEKPQYYWRENSLIIENMKNEEIFKLIQELTEYCQIIVGYESKVDHEKYETDLHIEIYDSYRE